MGLAASNSVSSYSAFLEIAMINSAAHTAVFQQAPRVIFRNAIRLLACLLLVLLACILDARSESCSTAQEMDAATKAALQTAAVRDFGYVAGGNSQSVLSASIPEIANNAAALENLLNVNKKDLAGATATPRNTYLLDATGGAATIERAEFYCGVFNSPSKVGFTLTNLPAGKYGLVILDVTGSKSPYFYSFLFLNQGNDWKIASLLPHPREIAGHDSKWYWQQARDFRAKGETHNAWLYYVVARDLAAPVPFMSTSNIDS